ncbi:MAG: sensor histidine kinase [Gammaproteobacteria bacterium]
MFRSHSSVRLHITIAVGITFAAALIIGSVLLLGVVRSMVASSIAADNHAVLKKLKNEIEEGVDPRQLALPFGTDGTQFIIVDRSGTTIASSLGLARTRPVVVLGPPIEIDPAEVPEIRNELGLEPQGKLLDESTTAGPKPPDAARATLDRLDERSQALWDPGNWSKTELAVHTPRGDFVLLALTPFDIITRSLTTLTRVLWIAIPVMVAAITILAWFVTGRALQPISRIIERAQRIGDSTLHERVPEPGSGDEVDKLAKTMNRMLERIEGAAIRQRQFVSDASHELRSPITAIIGEAEIALMHPDKAQWPIVAQVAYGEGRRLERLVSDLLALAKADEGPLEVRESVDVDELIFEKARRIHRLRVRTGKVSAVRVVGDPDQLSRVIENLLSNAVRHARSQIAIALCKKGKQALLAVDDDGTGIAPENRERIFERFARLQEGRSRDAGGAGLGLAVVRAVVNLHGGSAQVTDSALGGARFEVMLPLA